MLCAELQEVLVALDISLDFNFKEIRGRCPIHGGNNETALQLFPSGYSLPGIWQCHTRHCHSIFNKYFLGFVQGVLSRQRYDWPHSNKTASFRETIQWSLNHLGITQDQIKVDETKVDQNTYNSFIDSFHPHCQVRGIKRSEVRKKLEIPAPQYLNKYPAELLDRYDIGLCMEPGKTFCNRVVFPVYDETNSVCVGATGRTIFPYCAACKLYHEGECGGYSHTKWRHSFTSPPLYNFWFAKHAIEKCAAAILCEGPGDVLRLEQAGIPISLGVMRSDLTEHQRILLETSGAFNILVVLDADEAGKLGAEAIKKTLGASFNVEALRLPRGDLGEMSADEAGKMVVDAVTPLLWGSW